MGGASISLERVKRRCHSVSRYLDMFRFKDISSCAIFVRPLFLKASLSVNITSGKRIFIIYIIENMNIYTNNIDNNGNIFNMSNLWTSAWSEIRRCGNISAEFVQNRGPIVGFPARKGEMLYSGILFARYLGILHMAARGCGWWERSSRGCRGGKTNLMEVRKK